MKTMGALGTATILMAAALTAAFTGTKLETTPKPTGPVVRAKNILVFMVIKDPDRRSRAGEIFAGEIFLRGGTVTPSYRLFPELPKDKEAAVAKDLSEGFDGIIVANLVGEETKVKWKEGDTTLAPDYVGMDWWGSYVYTYEQRRGHGAALCDCDYRRYGRRSADAASADRDSGGLAAIPGSPRATWMRPLGRTLVVSSRSAWRRYPPSSLLSPSR